jgi:hypothetical protein
MDGYCLESLRFLDCIFFLYGLQCIVARLCGLHQGWIEGSLDWCPTVPIKMEQSNWEPFALSP